MKEKINKLESRYLDGVRKFRDHDVNYTNDFTSMALRDIKRLETDKAIKYYTLLSFFLYVVLEVVFYMVFNYLTAYGTVYTILIPFLTIVGCCTLVFGALKNNLFYAQMAVALQTLGVFTQISLCRTEDNAMSTGAKMTLCWIFGLIIGVLYALFYDFFSRFVACKKYIFYLLSFASIVLYFALLVFSKSHNGANAWIIIAGISIQGTEIIKLFAISQVALIISEESLTEKKKQLLFWSVIVVHTFGMVLCNELATLLIIYICCFAIYFLFMQIDKTFIICVLSLFVLAIGIFGACYGCNKYVESHSVETSTIQTSDNKNQSFYHKGSSIYLKIANRFSSSKELSIKKFDEDNFQRTKSFQNIVSCCLFGNMNKAKIPEIDSDFVAIYLLTRLGLISLLVILFTYLLLFVTGSVNSIKFISDTSALTFGLNLSIFLQVIFSVCSAFLLIPVVGVSMNFIVESGSSTIYSWAVVAILIIFNKRKKETNDQSS